MKSKNIIVGRPPRQLYDDYQVTPPEKETPFLELAAKVQAALKKEEAELARQDSENYPFSRLLRPS